MIKGVKCRAVHYDLHYIGNRPPRLKNCGPRAGATQAASIESVNLRRLVKGVARDPCNGTRARDEHWTGLGLDSIRTVTNFID